MKNILYQFILVIFLTNIICAQTEINKSKQIWERTNNKINRRQIPKIFSHNKSRSVNKPLLVSKLNSHFYKPTLVTINDSEFVNYTYDKSGNQLTELDALLINGALVNNFRFTNTYNQSGKLITDLYENWDNNAWVYYFKDTATDRKSTRLNSSH